MESLFPRAYHECPAGKQWYVCTAGDFQGCCSTDPCTSGVCPDSDHDDNGDSSSTLTEPTDLVLTKTVPGATVPDATHRSTTTSVTTPPEPTPENTAASEPSPTVPSSSSEVATGSLPPLPLEKTTLSEISTPTLPAESPTLDVSTSSDTSIVTEATTGATAVLAATNGIASPSSTPSDTPKAGSSNLGPIIGGVVGGIGALMICAIIIFCCCRRKKKSGKYSSLVAWYPSKSRKERATSSEMKGPLSPSDSEANTYTNSTRPNTLLSPDLTLSNSSTTNLSTCSPSKKPLIPPTPPTHTNELFASISARTGFTPELPDTGFYPGRAELASHAPSELINVPMEQRRRQQQNIMKNRTGPRSWESPALTPTPISQSQSQTSPNLTPGLGTSNHSRSQSDITQASNQGGCVVTADGVVLGANMGRYSTGLQIGEQWAREERERGTGRRGRAWWIRPSERSLQDEIVAVEPDGDGPPAYEAEVGGSGDIKSPSGRVAMSMRAPGGV
ncbi:hypothetical protein N7461_003776 [Penicillium sp. DV-2018c]|nr:hypothetical protein N7461_003776 [Penicillium sp. DV-2018c]